MQIPILVAETRMNSSEKEQATRCRINAYLFTRSSSPKLLFRWYRRNVCNSIISISGRYSSTLSSARRNARCTCVKGRWGANYSRSSLPLDPTLRSARFFQLRARSSVLRLCRVMNRINNTGWVFDALQVSEFSRPITRPSLQQCTRF